MIARMIAVALAGAAITLRADEVAYSDLEVKLPPSAGMSSTQPVQLASHVTPLAYPTNEPIPAPVAEPQPLVEASESPMFVSADGCADCIGPEYWEFNPWYAGVDLLVFRPSYTTQIISNSYTIAENDGFATLRPYVGWESIDGIGFRVRGWGTSVEYDLETTWQEDSLTRNFKLSAATIDIDFYKRIDFSRTRLVVGGGVKTVYELVDNDLGPGTNLPIPNEHSTATSGVTTFLELRHVFRSTEVSEWCMVGRGRLGALSGRFESKDEDQLLYEGADTMLTAEGAIGLEYLRHFKHHDFVFQYLAESQFWDSERLGKLGFDGASLRFGFQW